MNDSGDTKLFGGESRTDSGDYFGENKQPDLLKEWQGWLKMGIQEVEKRKNEMKRADSLFSGKLCEQGESRDSMVYDLDNPDSYARYNGLRRRINTRVNYLYAKNPKVSATVKKPFIKESMQPVVDPMTGQPLLDPMTGQPAMQPMMEDLSEQRKDVVEAIINHFVSESELKSEIKQAIRSAHLRPVSWLELGYDYDEDNQADNIWFRFRAFEDVISDPRAKFYDGNVRDCRFIACKWAMTEAEITELGLNFAAVKGNESGTDPDYQNDSRRYVVWRLWDHKKRLVGWVCENGDEWPLEPQQWPWNIDGFPFEYIKFTEDPGKKYSRPLVLEAEYLQNEQIEMRRTLYHNVVCRKPVILFEPQMFDKNKAQNLAGRSDSNAWIAVEGLSQRQSPPMQIFNDQALDQEFYGHYQRNEAEMDVVLSTTPNDLGQATKATATEVTQISQRAEGQFDADRDILEGTLRRLLRKAKQILEQVITEERIIEIVGPDGVKNWVPWTGDLLADTDLEIEVGSTVRMNHVAKQQLDINLLNVVPDPRNQPPTSCVRFSERSREKEPREIRDAGTPDDASSSHSR
jgi:hypothetical protein